jgi:hypothetical protein
LHAVQPVAAQRLGDGGGRAAKKVRMSTEEHRLWPEVGDGVATATFRRLS